MRIRDFAVSTALFLAIAGPKAAFAETCADALNPTLVAKITQATSSDSRNAALHLWCITKARDASGRAIIPMRDGSAVAEGANTIANESDCGTASAEQHISAAMYFAQTDASALLDAWKSCMIERNEELVCWPQRTGNDVLLRWVYGYDGPTRTIHYSRISVGGSAPAVPVQGLAANEQIYPTSGAGDGRRVPRCKASDDVAVMFDVKDSSSAIRGQCIAYVPAEPPPPGAARQPGCP
jgi:hypothetical protein